MKQDYESKKIGDILFTEIEEKCSFFSWNDEVCGYHTRTCRDLNNCSTSKQKPETVKHCYYIESPNCSDGIKNCHNDDCEVLVDCGGPCYPCPTCFDNIQNQGEKKVDCGGPCRKCSIEIPFEREAGLYGVPVMILLSLLGLIIVLLLIYKYLRSQREVNMIEKRRKKYVVDKEKSENN